MATLCVQTAILGHMTVPLLARRRALRRQTKPSWGSDGQTMLPVPAKLSVKSQRRVSGLYDAPRAGAFRAQLDRRLCDRYHAPVAWETAPPDAERAA